MKFLDGSKVPDEYLEKVHRMVQDACEAQERMTTEELDALERDIIKKLDK